jgi:hypothetical protein
MICCIYATHSYFCSYVHFLVFIIIAAEAYFRGITQVRPSHNHNVSIISTFVMAQWGDSDSSDDTLVGCLSSGSSSSESYFDLSSCSSLSSSNDSGEWIFRRMVVPTIKEEHVRALCYAVVVVVVL